MVVPSPSVRCGVATNNRWPTRRVGAPQRAPTRQLLLVDCTTSKPLSVTFGGWPRQQMIAASVHRRLRVERIVP